MAVRVRDDLAWLRETVVPRILAACPEAERIWLYGSRARGDHREGSDWGLMVVVPGEGPGAAGVEAAQAAASAAVRGQGGVQALVMSHADFHDRLHLRASFPSTIAREGVILHEERSMSRADTTTWIEGAQDDLEAMDDLLAARRPKVKMVLFEAQQTAEQAAKALLTRHDLPFPKTHELEALARLLRPVEPELAERIAALEGLGDTAMRLRYRGRDGVPSAESVAEELEVVRRLVGDLVARAAAD